MASAKWRPFCLGLNVLKTLTRKYGTLVWEAIVVFSKKHKDIFSKHEEHAVYFPNISCWHLLSVQGVV